MLTYQDFEKATNKPEFIRTLIQRHAGSELYQTAVIADLYDRQRNKTINDYMQVFFDLTGNPVENFVAANNKIASNFFRRLNVQRCTYSLGNGVSFSDHREKRKQEDGTEITVDLTKERLGIRFDTDLKKVGYKALIHGVAFGYWNSERLFCFPVTEFAPLLDENDGTLRAGARFWQVDPDKPMTVVFYEEDGYTKYRSDKKNSKLIEVEPKKGYIMRTVSTEADGEVVVGEDNYSGIPVVPMWGSDLHQSTLVGMREKIDSFDLIRSGFANDLSDCSEIYWILENYGGMTDSDLARFRDRLKLTHIAEMDTTNGGAVHAHTQEVPYAARQTFLDSIRSGIYEDFGGLDVHAVAAGATNDHIDAAYQPMDENADDFEYQVIEFVQQILKLEGIEDTPIFKRNRISNQREQTEMVISAAEYLDEETVLQKLPFITPDEVQGILSRKDQEDKDRMTGGNPFGQQPDQSDDIGADVDDNGEDI